MLFRVLESWMICVYCENWKLMFGVNATEIVLTVDVVSLHSFNFDRIRRGSALRLCVIFGNTNHNVYQIYTTIQDTRTMS